MWMDGVMWSKGEGGNMGNYKGAGGWVGHGGGGRELDGSVVVGGRQGMYGTRWGGMHGKGHVWKGLHMAYMVGKR